MLLRRLTKANAEVSSTQGPYEYAPGKAYEVEYPIITIQTEKLHDPGLAYHALKEHMESTHYGEVSYNQNASEISIMINSPSFEAFDKKDVLKSFDNQLTQAGYQVEGIAKKINESFIDQETPLAIPADVLQEAGTLGETIVNPGKVTNEEREAAKEEAKRSTGGRGVDD